MVGETSEVGVVIKRYDDSSGENDGGKWKQNSGRGEKEGWRIGEGVVEEWWRSGGGVVEEWWKSGGGVVKKW